MTDFCPAMSYTEQQIRGLAINFLRFHYKLRPRYLGGATRIVDRPHYYENVLIDARLAYQQPDRSWFTATVEATSVDRTEELFYRVNYWRLSIHSLVLALGLTASLVLAGTQVQSLHLWRRFGHPDAWWILGSFFAFALALLGLTLAQWRGYRYIYAVDQFKRFYADAQWVAFDAEIFAADSARARQRYAELERQCVKYGFGMLSVDADKAVRNVMSPSQLDQFGGQRLRLPQWLARGEAKQSRLPARLQVDSADLDDPLAVVPAREAVYFPARPGRRKWYRQPRRRAVLLRARLRRVYRSFYPSQLRRWPGYYELGGWIFVVGLLSVLLLGWGVYQQASYSPIAREGRAGAVPDLADLESATDPVPAQAPEEGEYRPTVGDTLSGVTIDVPEDALVSSERVEDLGELRRLRLTEAGEVRLDYDCTPLYALSEPVYLLVFGRYVSFETARGWAEELNRLYGAAVTVAAGDCVEFAATDYLLYLDAPLTEEATANFLTRSYLREGLEVEIVEIGGG